ncbi:glucose-1-phosphate thymidylyltransferase RfbA [Sinisalibacter aestuarii]|uniref:Glucose-1-phosphate thymidylyltransferase n=1 Tax=Sinisalibacter aestuarii TaxID=2949426 RepID=A0ABQ5LUS9_9RHOB|nr:glucose-1-phosphate thymidylyltransferase RfbA [Sinisalibacter aestuarii]GKY88629.1 glucose-1-phosphate thymidylyltransferase [Sinisalibacter aestuarii]
MTQRKGIILAGGTGTRLYPLTTAVSKQLLPVYDKPMIFYPLSVLMLAGIREIAVITNPEYMQQFGQLLGDGSQWGLAISYIAQASPDGLAQAYLLAEDFLAGAPSAMILGDNIFYGNDLRSLLKRADEEPEGGTIFGYHVADPERYGVIGLDAGGRVTSLEEKPKIPPSNYAITGLYFLDKTAPALARQVEKSPRGEYEITSLLNMYLESARLRVVRLGRGHAWLDTGTHGSLLDAGNFVRTLENRQGLQIGSPEDVAFQLGWIDRGALRDRAKSYGKSAYGQSLLRRVNETF